MSSELTLYRDLLGDIKRRVRQAQQRAALSANLEMLLLYWDIGRMIAVRRDLEGWGARVLPRLAVDLKNELPEEKGFSHRNLKLMVQFHEEYSDVFSIGQRPVAQSGEPGPILERPGDLLCCRLSGPVRILLGARPPVHRRHGRRANGPASFQPGATPRVFAPPGPSPEGAIQPAAIEAPLQGSRRFGTLTQGVALGWNEARRWRWERTAA